MPIECKEPRRILSRGNLRLFQKLLVLGLVRLKVQLHLFCLPFSLQVAPKKETGEEKCQTKIAVNDQ